MRHGPAEDRGPSGGDFDRALSAAGSAVVRRVAEELRKQRATELPRILASPLRRAQQTAALVRSVTGWSAQVESCDELSGSIVPVDIALELGRGQADALIVGHQPTLEVLVHRLAGPPDRPSSGSGSSSGQPAGLVDGFATAMIVALRTEQAGAAWTIETILDPRRLPAVGSHS